MDTNSASQLKVANDLLEKKKRLTEELLMHWNNIDIKLSKDKELLQDTELLKLGKRNLKTFLSNLKGTDEENIAKINSVGRKLFGGITGTERAIMLEFYFLSRRKPLNNATSGKLYQLYRTIDNLNKITLDCKSNLKGILRNLATDLDEYSKALRNIDEILISVDKESYSQALQVENKKDEIIENKTENIVNAQITARVGREEIEPGYSNSNSIRNKITARVFIIDRINRLIKSTKMIVAASGLLAIMLLSSMQANAQDTNNKIITEDKMEEYDQMLMENDTVISPLNDIIMKQMKANMSQEQGFNPMYPIIDNSFIGSFFGKRSLKFAKASKDHKGIDIVCSYGTPVYAVEDGTVIVRGNASSKEGYGLNIVIIHNDGTTTTLYGHLSKTKIKSGDKVKKGDWIAYVGSSGASSGSHLHFEIRIRSKDAASWDIGVQVDPLPFFDATILKSLTIRDGLNITQKESFGKWEALEISKGIKTLDELKNNEARIVQK
jgi:murein DD-endopeptidase MepM/ murein hydrolase activator NlpD